MTSTTLDTGTPELLATLDEGVLTLTFNRPDARNALSREVNEALQVQLAKAESNSAVKCLVLTGNGRAFCAGGDVKSMLTRSYNEPGSHTLDEYTASGWSSVPSPGVCSPCPSPRWQPFLVQQRALVSPLHWPATCASWPIRHS